MHKIINNKEKNGFVKLGLPAEKQNLEIIRKTISGIMKDYGFTRSKISGLEVSIVEHCENLIKYAYVGKIGYINVKAHFKFPVAEIHITDNAAEFNMLKAELPQLAERIKKGIGGKMGIRTIMSMCDEVKYERKNGKNINTFIIREK
jgi:anti-sigma regulatory factor (Ser/Thr protein kinase)